MLLAATLPALCTALTVKLLLPEQQAIIPFNKYGGPCDEVADCAGGLPGIHAVFRDEESSADITLRMGYLMVLETLVERHPRWVSINKDVWDRLGAQALRLHAPYINALPVKDFTKAAMYLTEPSVLPIVSTNLEEKTTMRCFFPHYHIFEPTPGLRIAVLVVWAKSFWATTVAADPYLRNMVSLLREMGVTTTVILGSDRFGAGDTDEFISVAPDVFLYGSERDSVAADTVNVSSAANAGGRNTFVASYDRTKANQIEVLTMTFDDLGASTDPDRPGDKMYNLSKVGMRVRYSTDYDVSQRDVAYRADEAFVQVLADEGLAHDKVLGYSARAMPTGRERDAEGKIVDEACRRAECPLGTLSADSVREFHARSEIVLINGGSLREGWGEGDVTRNELTKSMPFKNTVCHIKMTAAALFRVLSHATAAVSTTGGYNRTAEITGRFLQISGMRYSINPSLPPGERITNIEVQPRNTPVNVSIYEPLDPRRIYSVTTSTYLCQGGDDFTFEPASGTSMERTEESMWSIASFHLQTHSPYWPFVRDAIVYDMQAPPLRFVKTAVQCTDYEKFDADFETCEPCPSGYYHPEPGTQECVVHTSTSIAPIAIPTIVGGTVFLLVAYMMNTARAERKLAQMNKHAPREGMVTVVCTVVDAFSELIRELPDEAAAAMAIHNELYQNLLERFEGYAVKANDDSRMCVFDCPLRATDFLISLQVALMKVVWPQRLLNHPACAVVTRNKKPVLRGLRVCGVLHCGEIPATKKYDGSYDYAGVEVELATRLADCGSGGQILLTHDIYTEIAGALDDMSYQNDLSFEGVYGVCGFDGSFPLYSILPEAVSGRRFDGFRGVRAVDPEDSTRWSPGGGARANSTPAAHRQLIVALETIRKHVSKYGLAGITPKELAELLIRGCGTANLTECELMGTILDTKLDTVQVGYDRALPGPMPDNEGGHSSPKNKGDGNTDDSPATSPPQSPFASPTSSKARDRPVYGFRWQTVSTILRNLPPASVLVIAEGVQKLASRDPPRLAMNPLIAPAPATEGERERRRDDTTMDVSEASPVSEKTGAFD